MRIGGAHAFIAMTDSLPVVRQVDGVCTEDEVLELRPNGVGEFSASLEPGTYCAGDTPFVVDEGLFTEVAVSR